MLAALLRLCGPEWNANPGAGLVDAAAPAAVRAREAIAARGGVMLSHAHNEALEHALEVRLEDWQAEAQKGGRTLVYKARGRSDTQVSHLREPSAEGWGPWTVPTSMRDVELAVPLELRRDAIGAAPEDWEAPARAAELPKADG